MSGGGQNTVQTQQGPPAEVLKNYGDVYSQAKQVAGQPNQQYSGPVVAGFSPMQQAGFDNINTAANAGQPFIDAASQYSTNAATLLDPSNFGGTIAAYQSPYTKDVVDATQAQFNNQNQIAQNQLSGSAAQQGAFGGDRQAVAQAVLSGQQQANQAPVIAGLYNTGFQNATNAAQSNAWLNNATAGQMAGLGNEAQSQGLTAANSMLTAGAMQQAQQQAEMNVPYQAFLAAQGYPFSTTNWLEGMATGTGGASGGVSSTTSPGPSAVSQIAGLGLTGVAGYNALRQAGAFGGAASGAGSAAGAGANLAFDSAGYYMGNRGGEIPGYADGGGVSVNGMAIPDMSVTNIPVGGMAGSAGLMGPGGTLMKSTGTTSTTPDQDSTFGTILKTAGQIAAGIYGGPAGGAAAGYLSSQVHFNRGGGIEDHAKRVAGLAPVSVRPRGFDVGGGVTPGLSASFGGNPMQIGLEQSYSGLPDEQLHEMAQRYGSATPQGQMVARALQTRRMNPGANPAQPTVTGPPAQTGGMSGYAPGGEVDDDEDEAPDMEMPQAGPSVPGGLAAGMAPMTRDSGPEGRPQTHDMHDIPASAHSGYVPPPPEYVPLVLAAAEKHGVDPKQLAWLISTESHWNPKAYNAESGTIGLGQFKPGTAREVGIDPWQPAQAIDGSAAYLRKKLDQHGGDYEKAIGSYGTFSTWHGAGVDSAVRRRYHDFMGAARGGQIGGFADGGAPTMDLSGDMPSNPDDLPNPMDSLPPLTDYVPRAPVRFGGTKTDAGASDMVSDGNGGTIPLPPSSPPIGGFGAMPKDPNDREPMKASGWEALLAAGLGMMAGTSPHALTNIGAGGMAGLKNYQTQRQQAFADQARIDLMKTNATWRANQAINNERRTGIYGDRVAGQNDIGQRRADTYDRRVTDQGTQGQQNADSRTALANARSDYLRWQQTHGDASEAEKESQNAALRARWGVDQDLRQQGITQRGAIADRRDATARDDRERALINSATNADMTRATSLVSSSRDIMGKPTMTYEQALAKVRGSRPAPAPRSAPPAAVVVPPAATPAPPPAVAAVTPTFTEGRIYKDSAGRRARYQGGQWVEVP